MRQLIFSYLYGSNVLIVMVLLPEPIRTMGVISTEKPFYY